MLKFIDKKNINLIIFFLVYDYGTFGFFGALLAAGDTITAEGYSKKKHPVLQVIDL